ncbi:MAG: peptide chain release factor N(5)-glutamine methyltransferase, partial [Clostridia bacterium]|nr:peptide chain release factor N(5)-glutamine methyltransferase [Clostridia bacterium]
MTLSEITKKLADAGIESARHEALVLIEAFEHVPRSRAIADFEADYTSEALISAVERRATRYPLQYILGEWEFCGLTFHVDENCLIPRPDTEILVEAAVRAMPKGGRLLDLCTGSGCVACA